MSNYTHLIIGLGRTGLSIARFLEAQKGISFRVMDTRCEPSCLKNFQQLFSHIPIHTGSLNATWIKESLEIILSPGVDPKLIQPYIQKNCILYSDLDLFAGVANAPIIAITGTNGKSTVTVMIERLLTQLKKRVYVGGNLGVPALDLLKQPFPDFYVLELSSFQLSITQYIHTDISIFLNLSIDHLDRHQTLDAYLAAKQKIYKHCKTAIWNRDESVTYPSYPVKKFISFGSNVPSLEEDLGIKNDGPTQWLIEKNNAILNTQILSIKGKHNYLNMLAAIAAVKALVQCPTHAIIQAYQHFIGLEHRLECVARHKDITWINDSKATNVHATQIALAMFKEKDIGKVILIAGGICKQNDDFNALLPLLKKYTKQLIFIGKDALLLKSFFKKIKPTCIAPTLSIAVQVASNYATPGDTILFSPACSSQDMFIDYAERGDCFKKEAKLIINTDKTYVE